MDSDNGLSALILGTAFLMGGCPHGSYQTFVMESRLV
jgi:hypothetical protein